MCDLHEYASLSSIRKTETSEYSAAEGRSGGSKVGERLVEGSGAGDVGTNSKHLVLRGDATSEPPGPGASHGPAPPLQSGETHGPARGFLLSLGSVNQNESTAGGLQGQITFYSGLKVKRAKISAAGS